MLLIEKLQRKLILRQLKKTASYDSAEIFLQAIDKPDPFVYFLKGEESAFIMEQMEMMAGKLFFGFKSTDSFLIKINANSSLPYPASTDLQFLEAFLRMLLNHGFKDITIGDCSSNRYLPTMSVFKKLGITRMVKGKAKLIAFEEGAYVKADLGGEYLKSARLSKYAYTFDRIINMTNMKTHYLADYSLAMKNLVGFLHPLDRAALHESHLQEKVAELSLAIVPDLNIIDARRFFITGGPDEGEIAKGASVFVSNDMLKIDLEAYQHLYQWKRDAGLIGDFREDPAGMAQISQYMRQHNRSNNRGEES